MNQNKPSPDEISLPVNSWNEWDPLVEIVVGRADGAFYEPVEPGNRPQVRGYDGKSTGEQFPTGAKPAETIRRANVELENLSEVLRGRGVVVQRPQVMSYDDALVTPTFSVENQYCSTCPRDVLITVGNEIIEAPMSRRARYFEYLGYRKLIQSYWESGNCVRWTVAPKPSMSDDMYRSEFWDLPLSERFEKMHAFDFCITQDEVLFDAADITRCGADIFVQESMTTNRKGIEWLTRHFVDRGINVHSVHFPLDLFPSHIDCTFVPLRPGLVLTNPERPLLEADAEVFKKNGWVFLNAPYPASDIMPRHCQSSKWLSMNILSISPSTVICEENEGPLHDLLDKHGFEVITVPFRNVYEFGGSLHCATWDVNRSGDKRSYFGGN